MSSQELEQMLAALRDQNRGAEAPERVESALRSAFRAQAKRSVRRSWLPWALAAAAGLLVLIGATAAWRGKSVPPAAAGLNSVPAPQAVEPAPAPKTEPPLVAKRLVPRRRLASRPAAPAPQPRVEEVATEFLPLDDTENLAPIESGHVLRVQVPRSTLVRFGVPVNQDRLLEPIHADVVFAQDGIARAIRFVK